MALILEYILVVATAGLVQVVHCSSGSHGGHHYDHDDDDDDQDGGGISSQAKIGICAGAAGLFLGLVAVVICCWMKHGKGSSKSGKTTPIQFIQVADDSKPPSYDAAAFTIPMDSKPPPYVAGSMGTQYHQQKADAPPREAMYPSSSPTPSVASLPHAVEEKFPPYPEKF